MLHFKGCETFELLFCILLGVAQEVNRGVSDSAESDSGLTCEITSVYTGTPAERIHHQSVKQDLDQAHDDIQTHKAFLYVLIPDPDQPQDDIQNHKAFQVLMNSVPGQHRDDIQTHKASQQVLQPDPDKSEDYNQTNTVIQQFLQADVMKESHTCMQKKCVPFMLVIWKHILEYRHIKSHTSARCMEGVFNKLAM